MWFLKSSTNRYGPLFHHRTGCLLNGGLNRLIAVKLPLWQRWFDPVQKRRVAHAHEPLWWYDLGSSIFAFGNGFLDGCYQWSHLVSKMVDANGDQFSEECGGKVGEHSSIGLLDGRENSSRKQPAHFRSALWIQWCVGEAGRSQAGMAHRAVTT